MLNIQAISSALIISVAIQISCQAFKVVFYSIRNRIFEWQYFFSAGGMPSSHSAFVTALAVSIGFSSGFGDDLFALAFVFATVTIYDSIRLRGAVQTHSEVLSKLVKLLPKEEQLRIPQLVGHNVAEIGVGIVVGGSLACLASFLYLRMIL